MGFRENLLKKIEIKQLSGKVLRSINPVDSGQRIDIDAMRQLLEMGSYKYQKERDLDLYFLSQQHILSLDNELKIYDTTLEDVALRKSPTIKEMVSIRNAIKILSDKDVVVSRKADTVQRIKKELIGSLDLHYSQTDIESMAKDGIESLSKNYSEGVIEILNLFAELLDYVKAPKTLRMAHCHIWGKSDASSGQQRFGPSVIYGLMHNSLKMYNKTINLTKKEELQHFQQTAKGEIEPDYSRDDVFDTLKQEVMKIAKDHPPEK